MEHERKVAVAEAMSPVKRFERVLTVGYARVEVIALGGTTVGKGSYQPGWRWTSPRAPAEYAGVVLSGRAKVRVTEGREVDLTPGDFFRVATAHEVWVVATGPVRCFVSAALKR